MSKNIDLQNKINNKNKKTVFELKKEQKEAKKIIKGFLDCDHEVKSKIFQDIIRHLGYYTILPLTTDLDKNIADTEELLKNLKIAKQKQIEHEKKQKESAVISNLQGLNNALDKTNR